MEQQSEHDSFFEQDSEEQAAINREIQDGRLSSPNTKFFLNSITNRFVIENKPIDVLVCAKGGKKMMHTSDFYDFLHSRYDDCDLSTVSFVGSKNIGKSFLVDSLITTDNGKISRVMSRHPKAIVSTTSYHYGNNSDGRVQLLDAQGDADPQVMAWLYYISSVMVLNLRQKERSEEKKFLKDLGYILTKLQLEDEAISKPQLIIARRDAALLSAQEYEKEREFLSAVKDTGLFSPNITTLNIPFPGNSSVGIREILDIPPAEFAPKFTEKVKTLGHIIKNTAPKFINGNPLTSNFLAFTLGPLTSSISRGEPASSDKIWADIMREYSIGYQHIYLLEYEHWVVGLQNSEELFSDHEVHRILTQAKRNADKRTAGFRNLSGDPIFEEHRRQVEDNIKQREQAIMSRNHRNIEASTTEICQEAMIRLNAKNYHRIIDDYNKAVKQDYRKSDILLENFDLYMLHGPIGILENKSEGSLSAHFGVLESEKNELDDREQGLQEELAKESEAKAILLLEAENQQKEKVAKELEEEYRRLSKSEGKGTHKHPHIDRMEKDIEEIKNKIKASELEREELRRKKESVLLIRQKELEEELQREHQQSMRFRTALGLPGAPGSLKKRAGAGAKDTCCSLM